MNYKIIEVDGIQLLLRRDHYSEDDVVMIDFIEPVDELGIDNFYEVEIVCNSPATAKRYISDFSEESARILIKEAREEHG